MVLSVDKCVKVTKQLLDILHNENYPTEFPYKSKVRYLMKLLECFQDNLVFPNFNMQPDLEVSQ